MTIIESRVLQGNEFTDAELDQELPPRVLRVFNPRSADNVVKYSYKDRAFAYDNTQRALVIHFTNTNALIKHERTAAIGNVSVMDSDVAGCDDQEVNQLRNQFYYSDRSSQTSNAVIRQRGVTTRPPPSQDYNLNVSQCVIFDKCRHALDSSRDGESIKSSGPNPVYSEEMTSSVKVMERILNQNLDRDTFLDLKYFADPADAFRDYGSLLPLWRFENEKVRRKQVTCVKWNAEYKDLFAVSYGSYEFMKQTSGGAVAVYSLKNSKHPEFFFATEFTVCCIDWHPGKPALLAVGVYDGTVGVLDIRSRTRRYIYRSTDRESKHSDPVWELKWSPEGDRFTSISVDGRVCVWTMQKAKLECEVLSELKLSVSTDADGNVPPTALAGLINGLCFEFSPHDNDLYLVGTEEGAIHKCSRFFAAHPLVSFKAHSGPVYALRWNPFHKEIFVSCSADWTVKVWSSAATREGPLCWFDLSHAVGDVDWSPFTSTIFAAVNANGEIYVFDLHANRFKEVTVQKISNKGKLTRVCFNKHDPVIITGDDKGNVSCLKLSPNLRKLETDLSKQLSKINQVIDILSD